MSKDRNDLVQAVIDAWNNEGTRPRVWHEDMQRQLRIDWPVMHKAVKELAESNERNNDDT